MLKKGKYFIIKISIVMWDRGLRVRNVTFINFPSANTQAIYGPFITGRCVVYCGGRITKKLNLWSIFLIKS
jgi:hypothetical protein